MMTSTTKTGSNALWVWTVLFLLLGAGLFALRALIGNGYYLSELAAVALMTGSAIGLLKAEKDTVRPVFDPQA